MLLFYVYKIHLEPHNTVLCVQIFTEDDAVKLKTELN